jgi:erythromycin esterase
MRLRIFIILLTTFLNCQLYSQVEIVLGTEKQSIYPFALNEDSVQKDLKLLKSLFTSKKVIAIGESTHGSKEFFQAKSEIIKFLITSCGFKVISVEIDLISSLYINDYIKGRSGNLDSAMKINGYWIYYTP